MTAPGFVPSAGALEQALRGATAGDIVLVAEQCVRVGNAGVAIAVCEAARALELDDPSLLLVEAIARFANDDRVRAVALVDEVLLSSPAHLVALSVRAHMLAALGQRREARAMLEQVIDRFPDFPGALGLLSAQIMPGPPYRQVLSRLHGLLRPDTYLEIGVETGATLALATTATIAAGVDPAERAAGVTLPPNARTYRMESDAFFARETLSTVFEGRRVDLAFIDGMHWFEYALRDFANAERWASKDGAIVIHDCLPVTSMAARRERSSLFWVGDVWKILEALLDYRPDLRIHAIPTPPSGLVVVRGLDPSSTVLGDRMEEVLARYRDAPYPHIPGDWPPRFGVVENAEGGVLRAAGVTK